MTLPLPPSFGDQRPKQPSLRDALKTTYPQEWVWRHSQARGVVRYVLLAIARFTKHKRGKWETPPLSTKEIAGVTKVSESTVGRAVKELKGTLEELLVFSAGRYGKKNRYALAREMKLPLDVDPMSHRSERASLSTVTVTDDDRQPDRRRASERPTTTVTVTDDDRQSDRRRASERPTTTVTVTDDASDVRTKEDHDHHHHHHDDDHDRGSADEADADLQAYATWWRTTYPDYHGGVQSTLNLKAYGQSVRTVLAGGRARRPLALVQDMTIKLWTLKADRRSRQATYIATTDRSPHILRDLATWLEAEVKDDATNAAADASLRIPERQCQIDRCIAKLETQPDTGALGSACHEAAAELRAGDFDAASLDAQLVALARMVVDVDELEQRAHDELATYRAWMAKDAYDQAIRTAIDRLVRDRAKLPDLTVFAEYDGNRRSGTRRL
jgi:hypothetical protein